METMDYEQQERDSSTEKEQQMSGSKEMSRQKWRGKDLETCALYVCFS